MHIDQTITVENLANFLKKKGLIFNVCRPLREAPSVEEHKESHEEHAP